MVRVCNKRLEGEKIINREHKALKKEDLLW